MCDCWFDVAGDGRWASKSLLSMFYAVVFFLYFCSSIAAVHHRSHVTELNTLNTWRIMSQSMVRRSVPQQTAFHTQKFIRLKWWLKLPVAGRNKTGQGHWRCVQFHLIQFLCVYCFIDFVDLVVDTTIWEIWTAYDLERETRKSEELINSCLLFIHSGMMTEFDRFKNNMRPNVSINELSWAHVQIF